MTCPRLLLRGAAGERYIYKKEREIDKKRRTGEQNYPQRMIKIEKKGKGYITQHRREFLRFVFHINHFFFFFDSNSKERDARSQTNLHFSFLFPQKKNSYRKKNIYSTKGKKKNREIIRDRDIRERKEKKKEIEKNVQIRKLLSPRCRHVEQVTVGWLSESSAWTTTIVTTLIWKPDRKSHRAEATVWKK